ncbi:MAG: efflux RND transporter permease subunit, partial [Verrucomicrobia bacterium]|nr:efflux RND transporter permease subunit [Verrucomicrobiota bacterium]
MLDRKVSQLASGAPVAGTRELLLFAIFAFFRGYCSPIFCGYFALRASQGVDTLKFSHFFIDRPIFAAALSILIVLTGGVAYFALPVAQYPEIAPPTIQI